MSTQRSDRLPPSLVLFVFLMLFILGGWLFVQALSLLKEIAEEDVLWGAIFYSYISAIACPVLWLFEWGKAIAHFLIHLTPFRNLNFILALLGTGSYVASVLGVGLQLLRFICLYKLTAPLLLVLWTPFYLGLLYLVLRWLFWV